MRYSLRTLLIVLTVGPMVLVLPILTVLVHFTHHRGHVLRAPRDARARTIVERERPKAELEIRRLRAEWANRQ